MWWMCEIPERSRAREGNIPGAVEVEEEEGETERLRKRK